VPRPNGFYVTVDQGVDRGTHRLEMRLALSGAAGGWSTDGVLFFMVSTRGRLRDDRNALLRHGPTQLAGRPLQAQS
jgi:hypothetical protein